ncbi:cytochrome P450 [Pseudonocardia acidicola]|uniref:Cytochrome P450 n=1 Tax=Pseudonocardia acidicola TaxID=2724939 RepID=A0ABX1SN18_9PSEU|nr:cytochrome P450 [Pseudonocardia acidicola]NMI02203.1 cytochrome P450 [Pseudonocardia acidicola]
MPTQPVLVSDLDPFSREFLDDPYPAHAALRDAGPVVRLARYDIWATARHEPVHTALLDPEAFCSAAGVGISDFRKEEPWRPPSLLLEADPPEHTRARRVVNGVLSAAAIRRLTEAFTGAADELVAKLAHGGVIDGMAELARVYPLQVFSDAVGLPAEGREKLLVYGNMVFNTFGPRNELFTAAVADAGPIRDWIMQHCEAEHLAPGGMGAQIHERAAQEGFTPAEAAMLVRSFLSAGVDTTVHGLGNALLCLAAHPGQYDVLRAGPDRARAAFEEVLRFEAPVQTFFRTTTREVDLDGVAIPAGEKVLLFLGAANRDPRHWDDPDIFDIDRRATGHVGFGFGIHACVGMAMARLEGEAVLSALARRVARIEPAGTPERMHNNTLRGLASLPLRLIPS